MKTHRPCLSCGRDNAASAESCTSCGRELNTWASEADARPLSPVGLSAGGRRPWLVLAVVGLLALGAWAALRPAEPGSEETRPSWRRPASVADWAAGRLARRGAPPLRIGAVLEERTSRPRRLLLSSHDPELPAAVAVRAAAEVLLAARAEGERLLTHAALLEVGPAGGRRSLLVATVDAAGLLADDEALEGLAASGRPGGLPSLRDQPLRERPRPGGLPGEPGASPGEPVAVASVGAEDADAVPSTAPSPVRETSPAPTAAADQPPAVHVGLGGGAVTAASGRPTGAAEAREAAEAAGAAPARQPLPISLLQGPGKRPSHAYEAGEQGIVLLRAVLHPRQRRPLILRSLTVQPRGTLNDVDGVDFVYLVRDLDRNGRRDPKDPQVGDLEAFVDDDAPTTFSDLDLAFGGDGQPLYLLVVVDFLDRNEGGSIMLSLPKEPAIEVEEVASGALVRVDGAPLNGIMTTLNGDLEPDPFQAELDQLAAEAP